MAISKKSKIVASDMSSLINGLSISGNTITYTKVDGTTGNITIQDVNTNNMIPSDNYIELSTDISSYTAPANGWLIVCQKWTQYTVITLTNTTTYMGSTFQQYGNAAENAYVHIPCKKGDAISLRIGGGTTNNIRFIYAEGSL